MKQQHSTKEIMPTQTILGVLWEVPVAAQERVARKNTDRAKGRHQQITKLYHLMAMNLINLNGTPT
jgi:hypothetical protein